MADFQPTTQPESSTSPLLGDDAHKDPEEQQPYDPYNPHHHQSPQTTTLEREQLLLEVRETIHRIIERSEGFPGPPSAEDIEAARRFREAAINKRRYNAWYRRLGRWIHAQIDERLSVKGLRTRRLSLVHGIGIGADGVVIVVGVLVCVWG